MKLLVALDDDDGLNSKLSSHFGHCPFFAVFDSKKEDFKIYENEIDHLNKKLNPVEQVMKFKPDAVFCLGMGQRAIGLFKKKNVEIYTGDFRTLLEVIEDVKNLKPLKSGCAH